MLGAVKHALANLANTSGRDARQTFWYWILAVVVLRYGIGMVAAVPMMVEMFSSMSDAIRSGATPDAAQKQMMGSVVDSLDYGLWAGLAAGVLTVPLLAASLVRRLHDSDLSGWWILAPGLPYVGSLIAMPAAVAKAKQIIATIDATHPPDPWAQFQAQGWLSLLSFVPLLLVLWFGLRKSTDGPNRYGADPVRF